MRVNLHRKNTHFGFVSHEFRIFLVSSDYAECSKVRTSKLLSIILIPWLS
jgi:hypothetical protein